MKNIKTLIILITLIISFSCTLEETIYDLATPDTAIKTEADIDNALVGVYSFFNDVNGFGRNLTWSIPMYADDIWSTVSFEAGTFGRKSPVNSTNPFVRVIYENLFSAVSNANGIFSYLDNLDLPEDYEAKARSEAHFLRGFTYFYLVQIYGGVPLSTKVVNASDDFYQPRNSVDEVYSLILDDLEKAVENLPLLSEQPGSELYRATKGAAQGYLAKAYLTYANYLDLNGRNGEAVEFYQKAKDASDAIINSNEYSLISDYGILWDVNRERESYQEVIFGIPHTRDPADLRATGEGDERPVHYCPNGYPNSTGHPKGSGNGFHRVHPWFYKRYLEGDYVNDYRVEKSFITIWEDDRGRMHYCYPHPLQKTNDIEESSAYIGKYVDGDGIGVWGHENDLYLLRYSEILLMKAEAENELNGPSEEALAAFNEVRERARMADGAPRTTPINVEPGLSKEEFRMKIFDERGLEFVGEFNRWFDLIRMRYMDNERTMYEYQFDEFLPSLEPGLPKWNKNNSEWRGGETQDLNIVPFDSKYLLFPYPAEEIAINSKLTQNPGW